MTPPTQTQPAAPGTTGVYVYTYEDYLQDEKDKRRARLLVTLQMAAAILSALFFLRALLRND